jgi:hypothetical protein
MDQLDTAVEVLRTVSPLGLGGLVTLAVISVYKGWLTPPGVIRREDARAAVDEIRAQTAARVADAHERVAEALRRAQRAEEREERWRDAWLVSEAGRRLAAEQSAGVVRATAPLTSALMSDTATRGLPPDPPPDPPAPTTSP